MDCEQVLELLEVIRPGTSDVDAPEFEDARNHLSDCRICLAEFEARQGFDQAVFDLGSTVEVPNGLQVRLVNALLADASSDSSIAIADPRSAADASKASAAPSTDPKQTRRSVIHGLYVALLLLVAATVTLFWRSSPTLFAATELEQRIALRVSALDKFDGSFTFRQPTAFSANHRLKVSPQVKGQDLDGDESHDIALIRFSFSPRFRAPFQGVVVATPKNRVKDVASLSQSFARAELKYDRKDVVVVTWREGDMIYLCFVKKPGDMQQIQNQLSSSTA